MLRETLSGIVCRVNVLYVLHGREGNRYKDFKMILRYAHLAPVHKMASLGIFDGQLTGNAPANHTKAIQSNKKRDQAGST